MALYVDVAERQRSERPIGDPGSEGLIQCRDAPMARVTSMRERLPREGAGPVQLELDPVHLCREHIVVAEFQAARGIRHAGPQSVAGQQTRWRFHRAAARVKGPPI